MYIKTMNNNQFEKYKIQPLKNETQDVKQPQCVEDNHMPPIPFRWYFCGYVLHTFKACS